MGTTPQTVLADLSDLITMRAQGRLRWSRLNYDATGIGASWIDLLEHCHRAGKLTEYWPYGWTISGEQVPSGGLNVRKIDLMSLIQRLGNEGRLPLDPDLHMARHFTEQLQAISAKPTASGRLTFGAPGTSADDLVQAVSLALNAPPRGDEYGPRAYGTESPRALRLFGAGA